jgi:predicted phosphoribosyltransferase
MNKNIYTEEKFRNRSFVFDDRVDAGRELAGMLSEKYRGDSGSIVLAIPSGGVPVGMELAGALDLPMDLIIVRKVQIPGNTEAGFGSVSSTGKMFFNEPLLNRLGLSQTEIDQQVDKVKGELAEREKRFRGDAALPDLSGKTAIIADDGLASGFTMLAAVDSVRAEGAKRVIAAVPTAHPGSLDRVAAVCDEVYCTNVREGLRFAVAEAYRNWRDLEPDEVEAMVRKAGIIK